MREEKSEQSQGTGLLGVTGATGQLGQLVVQALHAAGRGADVVALVRDPAKAELGVASRVFDYNRPEGMVASLRGVERLLLISSNEVGQRSKQHRRVIAAAQQAGVRQVVYTSVLRAEALALSVSEEHWDTEQALRASGLGYTILRNGWYTENYQMAVAGAAAKGVLFGASGAGRVASAARRDYAEAAAKVLLQAEQESKVYELAGDSAWTMAEMAEVISSLLGRPVTYQNVTEAEYAAALQQLGLPGMVAELLAGFERSAEAGALDSRERSLSQLLGRPTTTLEDSLREMLAAK